MPTIRLIKHEAIPGCSSFEVRFEDGRPSVYFYFEDLPGRRLRPDLVDSEKRREFITLLGGVGLRPFAAHSGPWAGALKPEVPRNDSHACHAKRCAEFPIR